MGAGLLYVQIPIYFKWKWVDSNEQISNLFLRFFFRKQQIFILFHLSIRI